MVCMIYVLQRDNIRIDKVSAVAVNRVGCRWGGCWGRELAQGKRGGKVDEGIWLGLG